ncbi:MAG: prepilin-type N-terminal cleavage/methylation domain-containing protein [Bacteroidia bacterium]|nr:prepilin-type N-terminal cleavage/methylation domain-containing protein [Bacteroidia bacterium]
MKKRKTNEKGFTLIEVIVTLILVGITAALAGMWIVSVANGYIFAKMNASTTQKAQLAMTRLTKEFSAIQTVTAASATGITYTRTGVTPSTVPVTVSLNVNALLLNVNSTGAQTLTDSVSYFALKYCDEPTCSNTTPFHAGTSWLTSSRIIEITLTLTAGNNTPITFTQRVTPRNL